jgi:hypothetical protein
LKSFYRKLILFIFNTSFHRWLVLKVIPYIRFSFYYTDFRGWKYMRGYKHLEPGNFILTNDKWKLTGFLIPGDKTHAAFCVNKGSEFEIAEMTHTNFTHSTFFDLCKESTRVWIYEGIDWDHTYIHSVLIPTCLSFHDRPYDVKNEKGTAALQCSEMIYESDKERRLGASDDDLLGLGILYVSPTGLSKATRARCKWDSDDEIPPCWDKLRMEIK